MARGQYGQAVELTNQALALDSEDPIALHIRGAARIELGRRASESTSLRRGIDDARKAIELTGRTNSQYFLPYLNGMHALALVERNLDHARTAVGIADQLIAAETRSAVRAELFYRRGRLHAVLSKHPRAQADLQEAIRLAETHHGAWLTLADSFAQSGKPARARETFDEAARRFSTNPVIFNNRGLFLQRQGDLALAVADFSSALQLAPDLAAAATNRGYALVLMNDPAAALQDFDRALTLTPSSVSTLRMRAAALQLLGRYDAAIADLQRAVDISPDPEAQSELGYALTAAGQFEKAAHVLATASPQKPAVRPWYHAALLAAAGNNQTAKPDETKQRFAAEYARARATPEQCSWSDALIAASAGIFTAETLLEFADDEVTGAARTTEAHFFLALRAEMLGQEQAAEENYRAAASSDQKHLAACRGALVALQRRRNEPLVSASITEKAAKR